LPGVGVPVAVLLLASAPAAAQTPMPRVEVHIDPGAGQQFATQAGFDLASLNGQVQTELDRLFQVYRLHDYVKAFGDAQGFTTRGLGVDYGSNVRYLEVGVSLSTALNGNRALLDADTRTQPIAGVSGNLTLMAGVNLGAAGLPVTIFGNYFKSHGSYHEFDAHLENLGVHVQVKLLGSRDEGPLSLLVRWGGIDITTGIDRSHMTLQLVRDFDRAIPVSGGGVSGEVDLASRGTFRLDMRTTSIPLEVTTNLRFLYLLSLYGGGGFDWQLGGGSELTANLDGTLTGKAPQAGVSAVDLGTMRVNVTQDASPSGGRIRGIVGLQANVFLLKIFAQLNVAPDPFLANFGFGARFVW